MKTEINAKLKIKGQFECRDDEGNLLKVIDFEGESPIKLDTQDDDDCELVQSRVS